MTWQTGTTNDYLTALQALIDVATSDHVSAIAVNNDGSGYTAGDILTVAGGTFTYAATIVITSVDGGGNITGARLGNGGAYTVDPTLTGNSVTGGTGTGATFDLTMDGTGWTVDRREYRAARATIQAGGSGYSVGQFLTLVGGTKTEAGVFRIATVSGGAVTSVTPVAPTQTATATAVTGHYSVTPSNPVSTTVNTGGGTGCTLNVQYEQELIMEGAGSGSDDITIGIKTYQTTDTSGLNTCYNWALFGFGSFNNSLDFFEQVRVSPGFNTTPAIDPDLLTTTGAYVPLRDFNASFPITFWFNFTPSRLIFIFKVRSNTTTAYPSNYLGYLNPLGTTSELAYPMYVSGASFRRNVYFADITPYITGISSMVGGGGGDTGPAFYYRPATGLWAGALNSSINAAGTSKGAAADSCVYPGGDPNLKPQGGAFAAIVADGWSSWNGAIPDTGVPGTASWTLYPTPKTGGDLYWLIPATVIDSDDDTNDFLPYGETDEVFWVSRADTLVSEDTITISGQIYRVFQNGNRTENWEYMAVKETF